MSEMQRCIEVEAERAVQNGSVNIDEEDPDVIASALREDALLQRVQRELAILVSKTQMLLQLRKYICMTSRNRLKADRRSKFNALT